jgi:hypothetical protein
MYCLKVADAELQCFEIEMDVAIELGELGVVWWARQKVDAIQRVRRWDLAMADFEQDLYVTARLLVARFGNAQAQVLEIVSPQA